jgi:hypothetical protein
MAEHADLNIVFDCADPDRVARFWMVALAGYDFPHGPPEGYQTWEAWADATGIPEDQRNLARTLVDQAGGRGRGGPALGGRRDGRPAGRGGRRVLDRHAGRRRQRVLRHLTSMRLADRGPGTVRGCGPA